MFHDNKLRNHRYRRECNAVYTIENNREGLSDVCGRRRLPCVRGIGLPRDAHVQRYRYTYIEPRSVNEGWLKAPRENGVCFPGTAAYAPRVPRNQR